jgi:hypothetical protein
LLLPHSNGERYAIAIKAGARSAEADYAEPDDLTNDEAANGAMWARIHMTTDPADCPTSPAALHMTA